jgi:lipopolysaccharide transport system ATP-binding protein
LTKSYRIFDRPSDRIKEMLIPGRRRYHREFTALRDVSIDVAKGETIGIIGRNGSGKSTLLQLICGILKPSGGSVQVKGRISALLELGAGFNPEFTGRENVYFQGALMGLTREEMDQRFDAIAAFADIGEFIDQPVQTYSSGMFVRLAFAVGAHVDADILVIDEALSVGDVYFVQKCMRFLQQFIKRNGTVLLVSHDIGAVTQLCETVYWLDGGTIAYRGNSKEVTEKYLESVYERQQGRSELAAAAGTVAAGAGQARDMRLDFVNTTRYRNDIEIRPFPSATTGFGKGGAMITLANLLDEQGNCLSAVIGGEMVTLLVRGRSTIDMRRPLVGFLVKNRTGQVLFGDNTYLSYLDSPPRISPQDEFEATFTFRMPTLPLGDYSVTVAIADGSHEEHVQHHWIHDAVVLKSLSSSAATGLIGIPMQSIRLSTRASKGAVR